MRTFQASNDILRDIIRNAKAVASEACELLADETFLRSLEADGTLTDYETTLRDIRDDAERLSSKLAGVSKL